MKKFIKNNGLSLAFITLFLISIILQVYFGLDEHNKERIEDGATPVSMGQYLSSGHFIESTFENWESEFLQMGMFVVLTIFLMEKGSSESKKFDGTDAVDREPNPGREGAPWPVKKGGFVLWLYKRSLTLVFFLLFIISFILHFYGSLKDENDINALRGQPLKTAGQFMGDSKFWFESFQNWQSEFLSIYAMIVLSVYLRQKGSPQSKPVDAPHNETGE